VQHLHDPVHGQCITQDLPGPPLGSCLLCNMPLSSIYGKLTIVRRSVGLSLFSICLGYCCFGRRVLSHDGHTTVTHFFAASLATAVFECRQNTRSSLSRSASRALTLLAAPHKYAPLSISVQYVCLPGLFRVWCAVCSPCLWCDVVGVAYAQVVGAPSL
jgi:hypothetical protein